jgi:hypothetical protein
MSVSARDVMTLIGDWHPRKCKTEKDFEVSLHKHLEKNLPHSNVIKQYAAGRVKGDIVIDDKVLIEIKDSLESTGQLQRLLGQLDIYHTQWRGPKEVVVLICGDTQRDLMKTLNLKIESLKKEELRADFLFGKQRIFLIARDKSALPAKPQSSFLRFR